MYNPPLFVLNNKSNNFPLKRKNQFTKSQYSHNNDFVSFSTLYQDEKEYIFKHVKKDSDDFDHEIHASLGRQPSNTSVDTINCLNFDAQTDSDTGINSHFSTPVIAPLHGNQHSIMINDDHDHDLHFLDNQNSHHHKSRSFNDKRKRSLQLHSQQTTELINEQPEEIKYKIYEILKAENSKMISKGPIASVLHSFKVKCQFNHVYESNLKKLQNNIFVQQQHFQQSAEASNSINVHQNCPDCQLILNQVKCYAHKNHGNLISQVLAEQLQFECHKNHQFELQLSDYKENWCQMCKKILKQEFKEFLRQEEENRQKEYISKQEQLYNNAKRHYKRSYCASASDSEEQQQDNDEPLHPDSKSVIEAEKIVEEQIKDIAHKKAMKFIEDHQHDQHSDNVFNSVSLIQAEEVYKMILFPEQVLNCYFDVLPRSSLKKEYREFARHIHPDKNKHPQSSFAFQKLSLAYHEAIEKKKE